MPSFDRSPGFYLLDPDWTRTGLNLDLDLNCQHVEKNMATYQIPAPAHLCLKGDMVENVKAFMAAWNNWILATGLHGKLTKADGTADEAGEKVVAATLLSVVGPEAVRVINTLPKFTATIKQQPTDLLAELEKHFVPERHILFERYKFNTASQTESESVDAYVVRLRTLIESCDYSELEESILRDRLVIGTQDERGRERLLRERPVPDMARCLEILKAAELSRQHKIIGKQTNAEKEIHGVRRKVNPKKGAANPDRKSYENKGKFKASGNRKQESADYDCGYCGAKHRKGLCTAYGAQCSACGGSNHFAKVCWAKNKGGSTWNGTRAPARKVHQVDFDSDEESGSGDDGDRDDCVFSVQRINAVEGQARVKNRFFVNMNFLTEYPIRKKVQLDTGATCSAMSLRHLHEILQDANCTLGPPRGTLKLYDGTVVKPLGTYSLDIRVMDSTHRITFDIIKDSPWPIIDGDTCTKNGWITMEVHSVRRGVSTTPLTKETMLREYEDVFTGLGCLPGEYHIEVDPTIRPVQHSPRRVPVPLKSKLKEKIAELEKMGIIEKVKGHSAWISSMVAVQRKDKLRICIDPRDLNKAIRRPKHMMPTVDEVLPNLAKAKLFSVLDAKDGFFQIKLDAESTKLTTFWTPFGKYCFLRCPFGISSAPEEYQRRQQEVLEGLEGIDVIADDIICFGSGDTVAEAELDHDRNIEALLQRARQANLKLNGKKLQFKLKCVPYMGHLLTHKGIKPDPGRIEAIASMGRPDDPKAVQRLLGSVNYLARFLPRLSEASEPLRRLTIEDTPWHWESQQEEAYKNILKLMADAPVLRYYDVNMEVTVQSDASEKGLGAVLLQKGQPVTFASPVSA